MLELVMPFVAGRGTVDALPLGCPDMIVVYDISMAGLLGLTT